MKKKIRKLFLRLAAVFLLLLVSLYAFLWYRQYKSYQTPVHQKAETIIKLSIDELAKVFLREYEFDFNKDTSVTKKEEKDGLTDMGLSIPANIFIYNVSVISATTFFCTIPVDDTARLKEYAGDKLQFGFTTNKTYTEGKSPDGRTTLLYNNEYAAFAFSPQKEKVTAILEDLINKRNVLLSTSPLLEKLKKQTDHFTCINNDDVLSLHIAGNSILLNGSIHSFQNITISQKANLRAFSDGVAGYFFINAQPAGALNKTYKIKDYTFEADSIFNYYGGYMDMELSGVALQQDTVTTYEYDDNFEKKARQTVTQTKVPRFRATLQLNTVGMLNYLSKQGIAEKNQYLNREIFPLYQVSIKEKTDQLNFYTTGTNIVDSKFISSPDFFGFFVDGRKIRELPDVGVIAKYIAGVESIKASGKLKDQRVVMVKGSVDFEKPALKSVKEIIALF